MGEISLQYLKDLIFAIDKRCDLHFIELERTIANRFNKMDKKLEIGISEVKGGIKRLDEKTISIEKRLSDEALVSRSVMITNAAGLVTGISKFVFFN